MSKAHRGGPLKKEGMNRGTCPITGSSGVKLLYDHEEDGLKMKISKAAHARFKNIKKAEEKQNKAKQAATVAAEKKAEKQAEKQAESKKEEDVSESASVVEVAESSSDTAPVENTDEAPANAGDATSE